VLPQNVAMAAAAGGWATCAPSSQRLHLEREAERESRSEAVRTRATPVLPPVRERKAEREKFPFGAFDARL